jgi:Uma2 family endonuclease
MPIVRLDHRATFADLEEVPENLVAEIIDGQLIVSPRPAFPHAVATSVLGSELGPPFHRGRGGPGGWWIIDEPELHFGEDALVPDLAGWRRERLPKAPQTAFLTLAPDWLCEVLSPSTAEYDRSDKLRIYAREKVAHVWFVDPKVRLLEVLELRDGLWTILATHKGDALVRAKPFEVVEIDLLGLWGEERQAVGA